MRTIAGLLLLALTAGCASQPKQPGAVPPAVAEPAGPPEQKLAPATSAAPVPHAPATAAKAEAAAQLDLKGLERRLRNTSAIGLFTKLALKNQVDDLLTKFRTYHSGQQPPTLTDLRPNYELLIMKVQSLVQKDDPSLAGDVARSRETIWGVLADKTSFASI